MPRLASSFYITKAQAETKIKPDRVTDDLSRVAKATVKIRIVHRRTLQKFGSFNKLTIPFLCLVRHPARSAPAVAEPGRCRLTPAACRRGQTGARPTGFPVRAKRRSSLIGSARRYAPIRAF